MKKLIVLMFCASMLVTIAGCASESQTSSSQATDDAKTSSAPAEGNDKSPAEKTTKVGETITSPDYKLTIMKTEFSDKVTGGDGSLFYEPESGQTYLHVLTTIENTSKTELQTDDLIPVEADYDGGYKFTGDTAAVSNGYLDGFGTVKPLTSTQMSFLIAVPEEVKTSTKPLFVTMKIANEDWKLVIR